MNVNGYDYIFLRWLKCRKADSTKVAVHHQMIILRESMNSTLCVCVCVCVLSLKRIQEEGMVTLATKIDVTYNNIIIITLLILVGVTT